MKTNLILRKKKTKRRKGIKSIRLIVYEIREIVLQLIFKTQLHIFFFEDR